MRLFIITLCCFVSPQIVRADPTGEATIKAIRQHHGSVQQNGRVVILSANATDADIKGLAALNITTLNLSGTKLTDAGLTELAALKGLTTLDLSRTYVTDKGLKELAILRNLAILSLSFHSNLTDEGIKQLAKLQNLTYLDLLATGVSDTGLMELSAIPRLAQLRVWSPNLSEAGEQEFQRKNPTCERTGPKWREAIKP